MNRRSRAFYGTLFTFMVVAFGCCCLIPIAELLKATSPELRQRLEEEKNRSKQQSKTYLEWQAQKDINAKRDAQK